GIAQPDGEIGRVASAESIHGHAAGQRTDEADLHLVLVLGLGGPCRDTKNERRNQCCKFRRCTHEPSLTKQNLDVFSLAPESRGKRTTARAASIHANTLARNSHRLRQKAGPASAGLLKNQYIGQRRIDLPQGGVTDSGNAAEKAQVESPFAAVPAVVACI